MQSHFAPRGKPHKFLVATGDAKALMPPNMFRARGIILLNALGAGEREKCNRMLLAAV